MRINTKFFIAALGIMLIVGAAGIYAMRPEVPAPEEDISAGGGLASGSEMIMDAYFTQKMQAKADAFRAANPNLDVYGFSHGYSGFLYIKALPGLKPSDFNGVIGKSFSGESGGEYSEQEGKLSFMGHSASDSANIPAESMATLLINISQRLSLPITTEAGVDAILEKISR
jgi:hypothetical protein